MTFVVTEQGRQAEIEKRKKRNLERQGQPMTDGEAAARGAVGHGQDWDGGPCEAAKAFRDMGIADGPSSPMMPEAGGLDAQDFNRPYLEPGHGAPSPGYEAPHVPHVDLSRSRGVLTTLNPHAPIPVVGGPR